MTKRCSKCGEEKPVGEFYRDSSRRDGLSNGCKPCILADREAYRSSNREKLRAQAREDRRRFPERGCWQAMIDRCYDSKNQNYANYGGRGIRVCDRWRASFDAFLEDMGPRPSSRHTVDRTNVEGNYEPDNCRWATQKEQMRNTRCNRLLTAFGRTQCVAAWAEEFGVRPNLISDRVDRLGWDVERAIRTPPTPQRRHRASERNAA